MFFISVVRKTFSKLFHVRCLNCSSRIAYLMCFKIWGLIRGRVKRFYFLVNIQMGSGPMQLPFHWVPGVLSLGDRVARACILPLTSTWVLAKNNWSCTFPPFVWLHGVNRESSCLLALLQLCLSQLETFRKYWIVSFICVLKFSGQWLFWLWPCGSWPYVVLLVDINVMEGCIASTFRVEVIGIQVDVWSPGMVQYSEMKAYVVIICLLCLCFWSLLLFLHKCLIVWHTWTTIINGVTKG